MSNDPEVTHVDDPTVRDARRLERYDDIVANIVLCHRRMEHTLAGIRELRQDVDLVTLLATQEWLVTCTDELGQIVQQLKNDREEFMRMLAERASVPAVEIDVED